MCFYILVHNGEVISRSSVQHVTKLEMMKDDIKERKTAYDDEDRVDYGTTGSNVVMRWRMHFTLTTKKTKM